MNPSVLTVQQLSERFQQGSAPVVLDVREADEVAIAKLEGALHVPLSEFDALVRTLDRHAEYVVMCHHGIRSAHAAAIMVEQGFTRVANLHGGIDAWACEVDPSTPRY